MALNLQRRQMFIENSSGILVPLVQTAAGGIKVDTELDFSSGTLIGNLFLFKNTSGTAAYGLVDSSNRQILSPSSTISVILSGTQDVDITANSVGLMESTGGTLTSIPSGTQDIDITANSIGLMESTGGTLTPINASGNANLEMASLSGGTLSNSTGVQEVSLLSRWELTPGTGDVSGTLQALVSDIHGQLRISNGIAASYNSNETNVSNLTEGIPLYTLNGILNASDSKIQPMRNTASVSGGTITTGLLATGQMRYDGTSWRPAEPGVNTTTSGTTLQYTTSASTLLTATTGRNYGMIRNFTDATLYLGFGRVPTATNFDFYLAQNEAYEILSSNLFTGNIQGIGSANGTISILEW